jgi:hypothetical protein
MTKEFHWAHIRVVTRAGNQDDDPAHRGDAGFLLVLLNPFVPNGLADLPAFEVGDDPRTDQEGEQKGGHHGKSDAERESCDSGAERNGHLLSGE